MYGLLFIIAIIVIAIILYRTASKVVLTERGGEVITMRQFRFTPAFIGLSVIVLVILYIAGSFKVVPVGHTMVKFNIITKRFSVAGEGVTVVPLFLYNTYIYDLRRQEYTMSSKKGEGKRPDIDDSLWSPTKEGLQVGIDLTCWYKVSPADVIDVHRKIGPDFDEKVVRPAIRSVVRHVISEYPIMDVYSAKRKVIQDEIFENVKNLLEKDGFIIEEIVLRDVQFTPDFATAIEEKQIAQQEAERMNYLLDREKKEAERKKIEAQGNAKAIEIVSKELKRNPEYINYLYVDKLSDKVKLIISDQGTILNLRDILGSSSKTE